EQLISEAKRALEYKVAEAELRLRGRILRDEDEEDGGGDDDGDEDDDLLGGVEGGGEQKADFQFLGREISEGERDDEDDETGDDVGGSEEEDGEEDGEEHGESSFVASSLDGLSEEDSSMLDSSGVEDGQRRY